MSFAVSVTAIKPYLAVSACGPAALQELVAMAGFVAELTIQHSQHVVLADLGAVEPTLSFTDHLQFGARVASLFTRVRLLAAVVPPGYIDAPAAKAAQLAGVPLRTFLDLEPAKEWLVNNMQPARNAA